MASYAVVADHDAPGELRLKAVRRGVPESELRQAVKDTNAELPGSGWSVFDVVRESGRPCCS